MKAKPKLKLYSHIVTELATFEEWGPVAEKVLRFLNSDLKNGYPASFYFLHTRVKGKSTIYAGSQERESYKNDPEFTETLHDYDPPSFSGDYNGKRRKGT